MSHRLPAAVLVAILGSCCANGARQGIADPIPGVPETQQQTLARTELPRAWPFTVSGGTLGCMEGAVAFRVRGVTYALNDRAASRGFADVEAIRLTHHHPPSNPLLRLTQDRRMQIFARSSACPDRSRCRERLRDAHTLSDGELEQIESEGRERRWPPLSPERVDLAPVIDAAVKLCRL